MTRTGFLFGKLLTAFNVAPIEKYRTAAAFEAHLLRDSEMVVGELAWDSLEEVEEISAEYWKLRKSSKKRDELQTEIEKLTEILENSQELRAQALEEVAEVTKDKVDARDKIVQNIDRLHQEREDIQKDGRSIKRSHSGLKTKLEVLKEEFGDEESEEITETLTALKEKRVQFEQIKNRRDEIDDRIKALQKELNEIQAVIDKENSAIRDKAEEQFGTIGKTNKKLTNLRSQLGLIESERTQLCAEVGRFIIHNSKDPKIKQAARKQRGLLSLIEEIRASSNRYRRIIGN